MDEFGREHIDSHDQQRQTEDNKTQAAHWMEIDMIDVGY
jgi:hypothetical protein